ncbi:MAG: 16S rRNA (uracil(1498)-N(3))-methyltransferase [Candidatus Atribacteria bacterium]|nr:16S rRNA (uracil(1498)-N(3))-methyltransferase [Candidatus Atribacteria bacterium]
MPLFFTSPENIDEKKKTIMISGKEAKHITKSLRYKENEEILISDGIEKKYIAKIEIIDKDIIKCKIIHYYDTPLKTSPLRIILAQALLKNNKMDFVMQKATELGISKIIPFISSRTIPLIQQKSTDKKRERWQKIAFEASKQSERIHVPDIHPIIQFQELIRQTVTYDLPLIFWEDENTKPLKKVLKKNTKSSKIIYLIGPEWGFSKEEIESTKKANIVSTSLGKHVVRSETVAIFAMSIFNYHYLSN